MSLNSDSVSKRAKTETSTGTGVKFELRNIKDMPGLAAATCGLSASQDKANKFIGVFTEDILPEILDNLDILTEIDLLNFRLVNRCWRDAATSVLLKRNLCEIFLNFGKVALDENGKAIAEADHHATINNSYNYFNVYQPKSRLSDLNQLIFTSPKFPTTSVRFDRWDESGFENLCPTTSNSNNENQNQKDLLHFLSLYGKKIKKLSLGSGISKKAIRNLLNIYMPHLTSLDLQDFYEFSSQDETDEGSQMNVCLPLPSTLEVTEIVVGCEDELLENKSNFLKELISVCPNLSAIHDVDVLTLEVVLKMGKAHLITDLSLDPTFFDMSTILQFAKFLTDKILEDNLSTLKLIKLCVKMNINVSEGSNQLDIMSKVVSIILSANKNSLEYLQFDMHSSNNVINIFIPPLPHLKCLQLFPDPSRTKTTTRFHFLGDVIGRATKAGKLTADERVYHSNALIFQNRRNKISVAVNFPRLRDIILSIGELKANSDKMLDFFALEHVGLDGVTVIPGDTLSTVTTLNLIGFRPNDDTMAKLFPNVLLLKISCWSSNNLRNWIWTAFRKLEKFEISNLTQWDTKEVDSFFTGLSPELIASFRSDGTSAELESAPALQDVKRTQPYIGDCKNLKEFKIVFLRKLKSMFASKVTAIHGFQKIFPRTKIIFSFESVKISAAELEETRQYLDPIAAYVEIRMKK